MKGATTLVQFSKWFLKRVLVLVWVSKEVGLPNSYIKRDFDHALVWVSKEVR